MTNKHSAYPGLEIISIHIPKTGGISFLNLMNEYFGNKNVARLQKIDKNRVKIAEAEDWRFFLKQEAHKHKVIHGHFRYRATRDIHLNSKAKVIVWIRDPVERVISRYYFLQKKITDDPHHPEKERKNMGLINYATISHHQNVMSRYLMGISLEDLFFVGVLEQYDQSVEEFKQLLGITKKVDIPWKHNNSEFKNAYNVPDEMREIIAGLNQEDITLYKKILEFKGIT